MPKRPRWLRWSLTPRATRLAVYLLVVLGVVAWKFLPRPWKPDLALETAHFKIQSTATREQTEEMARAIEALYAAYSERLGALPFFQRDHPRLQLLLYRDRREMRRVNPGLGWAEAYYRKPYCRAYYSAAEVNPHHWMLHEVVHQLNEEVAHLNLAKWIEEGFAAYFSTSRIREDRLIPGTIDPNTYPVWWIETIATTPDLARNVENGSVIPLRTLITNEGGPSMKRKFNLYYLHWWTLTHFIFEHPKHRLAARQLLEAGGHLDAFERLIGPVDEVEVEWHACVQHLKATLARPNLHFFKTGEVPPLTNPVQVPTLENGRQP